MTGLWGGFRERRHSQPLFEHGPPHQHTEPVSRQHERPTASAAWRQMSTPLRRGPAVSPYSTGTGAPRRCQRLRLRAQAGAVQHPHEGGSRQSPSPAAPGFRIGRAASVRTRPVPSSPSPGGCKPWCRCARSDACFPFAWMAVRMRLARRLAAGHTVSAQAPGVLPGGRLPGGQHAQSAGEAERDQHARDDAEPLLAPRGELLGRRIADACDSRRRPPQPPLHTSRSVFQVYESNRRRPRRRMTPHTPAQPMLYEV